MILGSGFLLTNCNSNSTSQHTKQTGINGRYINETFLKQVPDSVAGSIQGYCYEMNFISADSVVINYGSEHGTLAYLQKSENSYVLLAAQQGNDLNFTVNGDSTITLHDSSWIFRDSTWIGARLHSKFKKVPDVSDVEWVFNRYLNEKVIAGHYILDLEEKPKDQHVVFQSDGKVNGLFRYTTYAICFSGDCIGETQKPSNIISLSKADGLVDTFVFTIDSRKNKIAFFALGHLLKDHSGQVMKGGRGIGQLVFELEKEAYSAAKPD